MKHIGRRDKGEEDFSSGTPEKRLGTFGDVLKLPSFDLYGRCNMPVIRHCPRPKLHPKKDMAPSVSSASQSKLSFERLPNQLAGPAGPLRRHVGEQRRWVRWQVASVYQPYSSMSNRSSRMTLTSRRLSGLSSTTAMRFMISALPLLAGAGVPAAPRQSEDRGEGDRSARVLTLQPSVRWYPQDAGSSWPQRFRHWT